MFPELGKGKPIDIVEERLQYFRENKRELAKITRLESEVAHKQKQQSFEAANGQNLVFTNFLTTTNPKHKQQRLREWLENEEEKRQKGYDRAKKAVADKYQAKCQANSQFRRHERHLIQRYIDRQSAWIRTIYLIVATKRWRRDQRVFIITNAAEERFLVMHRQVQSRRRVFSVLIAQWRTLAPRRKQLNDASRLLFNFLTKTKSMNKAAMKCQQAIKTMVRRVRASQRRWRAKLALRETRLEVLEIRFLKTEQQAINRLQGDYNQQSVDMMVQLRCVF
jgi:hypothetical protein